jgi:hypothetical protein
MINTYQAITAWTQGRIVSGVWSAGSGAGFDVYRTTSTVSTSFANAIGTSIICGLDMTDGRGLTPVIPLFCATLADVAATGDFTMTGTAGATHIYIKTGVAGQNPVQRWGGSTVYCNSDSVGRNTLFFTNPKGVALIDHLSIGGKVTWTAEAEGTSVEDCYTLRCGQRGASGNGENWTISGTLDNAFGRRCQGLDNDLDSWDHPTTRWRGATNSETSGQNGFHVSGKWVNFLCRNLSAAGYSHGQYVVEAGSTANVINQTSNIAAQNTYGAPFFVSETGRTRTFRVTISGTWAGRVTLQRSATEGGAYTDVKKFYTNTDEDFNDLDTAQWWYRIGINTGEYTSGTAVVQIRYQPDRKSVV